jgi:hypothetical protein
MLEGVSVFALVLVAFMAVRALMGERQAPPGLNDRVVRFVLEAEPPSRDH